MRAENAVVEQLLQTGKWSLDQARAGIRADFRCEYCDLDLIENLAHYKLWQLDHIIPRRVKEARNEDPDDLENLAISCKACNCDFKKNFDPSRERPGASRATLVQAVKDYIAERRKRSEDEVARIRAIVGR